MASSLLLRSRNFRLLWVGQLVSQIGTKIYLVALAWYFVSLGDDHGLVTMLLCASLPLLVFGPLAGPLVDRFDRRRILIVADVGSALVTAAMATAVHFRLPESIIFAGAFLLGVGEVFFNPSAQALVPSMVEKDEVQEATAILSLQYNLARFLGAALGGALVGWLGVRDAIVVNAVSFLVSALTSVLMHTAPFKPTALSGRIFTDLKDGFVYVLRSGVIFRLLVLASLLNVFFVAIVVYLPILIQQRLHMSAVSYGTAEACAPVGSVVAALISARYNAKRHLPWVRATMMMLGLSFIIIAWGQTYPAVLVAMTLMGATLCVANIHIVAYFLLRVNPDYMGRFFNLMETIAFGTFPLAYLLAGALVVRWDIYHLFLTNGLALIVLGASSFLLLNEDGAGAE